MRQIVPAPRACALVTVLIAALFLAIDISWCVPAAARNVALVIGNANYKIGVLKNPKRDAAVIADRLKDLGFEVSEVFDGDAFSMNRAAANFLTAAKGADLALFYFAGHGIQLFDRNFLVARDVDTLAVSRPEDLGIDLSDFMTRLRRSGAVRHALFIDACRDNPLSFDDTVELMRRLRGPEAGAGGEGERRVTRGLANVQIPETGTSRASSETLVFFAAQPGAVSYDGEGQNSFFVEGIKEGLSERGRTFSEMLRHVVAYVRTVTNGGQIPQVVSDWTGDLTLGETKSAKVSYNVTPQDERRTLSKSEEDLVIRSVTGYTRFKGDFIVKASELPADQSELSDEEKAKASALGSVNGFSIAYDLDRDGRDEIIHVYFRQTSYVIVVEKDGVRVETDTCLGPDREKVNAIEVALKDINGDRRPEVWIAYDTGGFWSTFCILEYKGIANIDKYRRGNTGLMYEDTPVFRTLLRAGAGWGVTVGNDNSIKVCAGSNCHSPAAYTFDGEAFRMQYSELGSEPDLLKDVPFHDENERAKIIYDAYRRSAVRLPAGPFQTTQRKEANVFDAATDTDVGEFGYRCTRFSDALQGELFYLQWPTSLPQNSKVSLPEAFAYGENLKIAPVLVDGEACLADSVTPFDSSYEIALSPSTASRCVARLMHASSIMLPVAVSERGLLRIELGKSGGRDKIAAARESCLSGKTTSFSPDVLREGTPDNSATAVPDRFIRFAQQYLQESVPYAESVDYYKEKRTRGSVMADKQKYYARWPVHVYTLDPASLKVSRRNGQANIHEIEFEYDFKVAKGSDARAGRGVTRLTVEEDQRGEVRVIGEDGKVLRRF